MRASLLLTMSLLACSPTIPEAPDATARGPATGIASGDLLVARVGSRALAFERLPSRFGPAPVVFLKGEADAAVTGGAFRVGDGPEAPVVPTGGGAFQIALNTPSLLEGPLTGLPVELWLDTADGPLAARVTLTASLEVGPSPELRGERALSPVYVRDPAAPLRLRAAFSSPLTLDDVWAEVGGDVLGVDFDAHRGALLLGLDAVVDLLGPAAGTLDLHVVPDDGSGERIFAAELVPEVVGLTVARHAPPPERGCDPAVLDCAMVTPGTDLAACGSYLEVAACEAESTCVTDGPGTGQLVEITPPELDAARLAFDASCVAAGDWCGADDHRAWQADGCARPDLDALLEGVFLGYPEFAGYDPAWGTLVEQDALHASWWFSTAYTPDGPKLAEDLRAWGGPGPVTGWFGDSEVPCPNCHQFRSLAMLWFEATGRIVVIRGYHGYDS